MEKQTVSKHKPKRVYTYFNKLKVKHFESLRQKSVRQSLLETKFVSKKFGEGLYQESLLETKNDSTKLVGGKTRFVEEVCWRVKG